MVPTSVPHKNIQGGEEKQPLLLVLLQCPEPTLKLGSLSMGQKILKSEMTFHIETCNDALFILWTPFLFGIDSCFFHSWLSLFKNKYSCFLCACTLKESTCIKPSISELPFNIAPVY